VHKTRSTHHFVVVVAHFVDDVVRDDDGASLEADPAARPDPEENRVFRFGVVHQFNYFVQEDSDRWHSHSVLELRLNYLLLTKLYKLTLTDKTGPTLYMLYR
jgi:hypothetical protein